MKTRKASYKRATKETNITVGLTLEGLGHGDIKTPIPFLNHMLDNFTRHGAFNLKVRAKGDVEIDDHHTFEDLGLVLGETFEKALGDKKGINRAGYFVFPMDEALSLVAVDISGRAFLSYDVKFKPYIGGHTSPDLIKHFFEAFSRSLKATVHVRVIHPGEVHHQAESIFKAFGKAMKMACSQDARLLKELPSTKGKL
jgi:imidazoleglycerol-phosphate dehydratase